MTTNNSQIGNSPSTPSFDNHRSQSNIDQLLSDEIVTTNQSSMQFNQTNMIPTQIPPSITPIQQRDEYLTIRQEGRRRRRRRQRQRRQERRAALRRQREEQWQQEINRMHRRNQRNRREQQRRQAQQQELPRQQLGETARLSDILYEQNQMDETSHQHIQQQLVKTNHSENTHADDRWEQEQIAELEGFVLLEQLTLIQDENEQSNQIEAFRRIVQETKEERDTEQLHELETWENEAFLVQQQLDQN